MEDVLQMVLGQVTGDDECHKASHLLVRDQNTPSAFPNLAHTRRTGTKHHLGVPGWGAEPAIGVKTPSRRSMTDDRIIAREWHKPVLRWSVPYLRREDVGKRLSAAKRARPHAQHMAAEALADRGRLKDWCCMPRTLWRDTDATKTAASRCCRSHGQNIGIAASPLAFRRSARGRPDMISCRNEIHRHSRCGPYVCLGPVACDDEADKVTSSHGRRSTDGSGACCA